MKILIVNRFFGGAQIPTGRMAEDVALKLVEAGHEVVALASSGEYVGAARRADGIRHAAYGTRVEQVRVPKWMPRAFAWLWFTWQARERIPRMDWDVCVLMTDPPLLPLLAARVKAAEGPRVDGTTGPRDVARRVAVWLMDLYPEALAASGRIATSNPVYRWYFEKRQRALSASDVLICLGEEQKALVERHEGEKVGRWEVSNREQGTGDGEQVERKDGASVGQCLPSDLPHAVSQTRLSEAVKTETPKYRTTEPLCGALTDSVRTAVVPPWDDRGNIALATENSLRNLALYAGNLGEAHCFEEILAAAPYLPGDWTIRFAARGAKLGALKAAASGTTGLRDNGTTRQEPEAANRTTRHRGNRTTGAKVEITGYANEEETPGLLASARVHLITMSPGWEGVVVPSKLYGCVRTGRPVLFIGPENADTAREVRAHDWGKVLPPGPSGEKVAGAILELATRPTRAPQLQHGAGEIAALLVATAGLQDNGLTGQQE